MFKKIGQSSVGVAITYIVKTTLLFVFARLLSPVDYGIYGATMVIVNFAQRFTDIGFGPALVQRKEITEIQIDTAFTVSIFLGISLTCITFFCAAPLSRFIGIPETYNAIRAMSLIFIIKSIYSNAYALLQRDLDFNFIVKIDIFSYLIASGVIGLAIALAGGGIWALVIAEVCEAFIACGIALYKRRTRYTLKFNKQAFNQLSKFGVGQIFYQLTLFFVQQSDNFIVGKYMGAKALGIYGRAYALLVLPSRLFGLAAGRVIFPSMAKIQNDLVKFKSIYLKLLEFLALLAFPLTGFLTIASEEFTIVAFGDKWNDLIPLIRIFSYAMFFRLVFNANNIALKSVGKIYYTGYVQIVVFVLIIIGCYLAYPYGLVPVTIVVSFVLGIQCYILTQSLINYCKSSWKEVFFALQSKLLINILFVMAGFGVKLLLLRLHLNTAIMFFTLIIFYGGCMWIAIKFFPRLMLGSLADNLIQVKKALPKKLKFIL